MIFKSRKGRLGRFFGAVPRLLRVLRWTFRVFLVLLIADLFYLGATWPEWERIAAGPAPESNFIRAYRQRARADKKLPPQRWRSVALASIPAHVVRAVILAEDSRFYEHGGFDLIAFREAMDYNLTEGRFLLGASTISQQTAKNLFLSPSRDPLRKWHELILTWGMERKLSKKRIMEIYLNIAEFGEGVYGVQAAALSYWDISAAELSMEQAAELAASLPSPRKHNPATRTPRFLRRAEKILGWLERFPGRSAALSSQETDVTPAPNAGAAAAPVKVAVPDSP